MKWEGDHGDVRDLNAVGVVYCFVFDGPKGTEQTQHQFRNHDDVWAHVKGLRGRTLEVWYWRVQ